MEALAENLWTAAYALRFFGVETGTRTTVVRLADGRLFLHSPGPLDSATRTFVARTGPVAALVAPSLFHHLFVGERMLAWDPERIVLSHGALLERDGPRGAAPRLRVALSAC